MIRSALICRISFGANAHQISHDMPDAYFILTPGFPLVMVVLSLVMASSQDDGVDTYVHGDL